MEGGGGRGRVERGIAVAESRKRGMVLGRGCGAASEIQTGNPSKSVLDPVNSLTSFLSWCFMSTETTGLIRDGAKNGTGSESSGPPVPPCSHSA